MHAIKVEDVWKGHIFLFDHDFKVNYTTKIGTRLIAAFVLVGLIIIPSIQFAMSYLDLPVLGLNKLLLYISFLALFFLTLRYFVRLKAPSIGLMSWQQWSLREKVYFSHTFILMSVAFAFLFDKHFTQLINSNGLFNFLAYSVLTGVLWGVFQELVYRGFLQTELVRRFGSVAGIIVANCFYTFGPLHSKYFHFGSDLPIQWSMFLTVFIIGGVFALMYHRSGNLWIPAVFHGLWPMNMN